MGDVIDFPRQQASRPAEASLLRHADEQARRNAERAAVVEGKMKDRRKLEAPRQRQIIGENLGKLVDEADTQGIAKGDIVAKARMGGSTGGTRVLRRYALAPGLPEDERKSRADKVLLKKTENYRKLARAAAEIAGWDWNATLLRLVEGTVLDATDAEAEDIERDSYLVDLARLIERAAASIARESDLDGYFRTITDHDLAPDGDDWEVTYDHHYRFDWTFPGVILFYDVVRPARGRIVVTKGAEPEEADISFCNRYRLVLAPLGSGRKVQAFIGIEPCIVVRSAHPLNLRDAIIAWEFEGSGDWHYAPNHQRWIIDDAVDLGSIGMAVLAEQGWHYERETFVPVSVSSLREHFARPANLAHTLRIPGSSSFYEVASLPAEGFTLAPGGTLALRLERSIRYGISTGSDVKLFDELRRIALRDSDGLRRWVEEKRAALKRETEELLSKLG